MARQYKGNLTTQIGFFAVIVLMILTAGIAISEVNNLRSQLDRVVSVNAEKLRQIVIMRRSNRERIIGLQAMLLLDDIFEIDAIAMEHMGHANKFIDARRKLYEMADSQNEIRELDLIRLASMEAYPINTQIRDLALAEEPEKAKDLMLTQLIPVQEKIYAGFERLASIYDEEARIANQRTTFRVDTVNQRILLLLGFVTVLCIFIASNVSRRITRSEQALIQHKNRLELDVEQRTTELAKEVRVREAAESFARNESERLAVTLASIGDAVVTVTPENTVDYMNPVAEQLTQVEQQDAIGQPVDKVLRLLDYDAGDPLNIVDSQLEGDTSRDAILTRDGRGNIDIQWSVAQISDDDGHEYGSVVVLRDVSEAKALSRKLSHEATHDPLTGLFNRREFERNLEVAIEAVQNSDRVYTLCYIDLDRFKVVNDTAGHSAGDKLLKEISEHLKLNTRPGDTLARLGGDEFALLLEDCTLEQGARFANRLLQTIQDYRLVYGSQVFSIGASIGVIGIPKDTRDLESLLGMADAACYAAKEKGRNCVNVFQSTDSDITLHRDEANFVGRIRTALEERQFELHCQPIVGIGATFKNTCHYEILVRMKNPDDTLVYPMQFLPAAQRYGLLSAIDQYVIEEVFNWLAGSTELRDGERLSINLSGSSLSDPGFLPLVQKLSRETGVQFTQVIFEITESVAISNLQTAVHFMETLSAEGCEFALDDFGKGFSSLTNLKGLPVDYLKIDGDFVKDILSSRSDEAAVRAINELGHALGMRTVAEFVESQSICAFVQELGVDFAQGFGMCKPFPLSQGLTLPATCELAV